MQEITDRAQTQALLYEQNDQLWKYLHELLNIHNQNATTVKQLVSVHTYIHTYIHTNIYINTYIHTYIVVTDLHSLKYT